MHELLHQEGIARRLAHDRVHPIAPLVRVGPRAPRATRAPAHPTASFPALRLQESVRQAPCVHLGQGRQLQLATRLGPGTAQQRPEEGRGRSRVLAREARDHEERRWVGGGEQRIEQHDAVGVAPLQVVDVHYHRLLGRDAPEQALEGAEPLAPQLHRVHHVALRGGELQQLRDPPEHGKQLQHRREIPSDQAVEVSVRERPQEARETVDHAVQPLVRHRLAHVAPAREHHRTIVGRQLLDEPAHERRLPDPRRPAHDREHGTAALREPERPLELGELRIATDEQRTRRRGAGRHGARRWRRNAKACEDLVGPRASLGASRQQVPTQRHEVCWQARLDLARIGRVLLRLFQQYPQRRSCEWQPAGERLVQHAAHRVPVARRARLSSPLLGRHVFRGPPDPILRGAEGVLAGHHIRRNAEIEDHGPAFRRHYHIRWLQVAMQLARAVECDEAGRQLGERRAEPLDGQDVGSDELEKATALHELHGEVPFVRFAEQLVQRYEVGMDNADQRAEFPFQPIDRGRIGPPQGLEGHDLVPIAVEGLVHHPHAAGAEAALDLESLVTGEPARVGHHGPLGWWLSKKAALTIRTSNGRASAPQLPCAGLLRLTMAPSLRDLPARASNCSCSATFGHRELWLGWMRRAFRPQRHPCGGPRRSATRSFANSRSAKSIRSSSSPSLCCTSSSACVRRATSGSVGFCQAPRFAGPTSRRTTTCAAATTAMMNAKPMAQLGIISTLHLQPGRCEMQLRPPHDSARSCGVKPAHRGVICQRMCPKVAGGSAEVVAVQRGAGRNRTDE